jgi:hypothetical protein
MFPYLLGHKRFDFARWISPRSVTSYPILVIRKPSKRRFSLVLCAVGMLAGVMSDWPQKRCQAFDRKQSDAPAYPSNGYPGFTFHTLLGLFLKIPSL